MGRGRLHRFAENLSLEVYAILFGEYVSQKIAQTLDPSDVEDLELSRC